MLSYRKSQQVLLAEKLKKKNVIHAFGVSGSGTTMARLCHSAFARVATILRKIHSGGLVSLPQRIRAGCDAMCATLMLLMRSLPQRIRAGCDGVQPQQARSVLPFATAHSRGLRRQLAVTGHTHVPLPQRIRAGCDLLPTPSASLYTPLPQRIRAGCDSMSSAGAVSINLCHSAFARVATASCAVIVPYSFFATAHSCGLRRRQIRVSFRLQSLPQRIRAGCDSRQEARYDGTAPLPQRIRAGCDCGKAMQRTANLLREGR